MPKHMTATAMLPHYLETICWSSPSDNDGNEMDSFDAEFSEESKAEALADLEKFIKLAGDDLKGMDPGQTAHDFALTRNHHGAGFWDHGLGKKGDRLTEISHKFKAWQCVGVDADEKFYYCEG